MATTSDEQIAAAAREALATNQGVTSIEIDGRRMQIDQAKALDILDRFERRAARRNGTRPPILPEDLQENCKVEAEGDRPVFSASGSRRIRPP
jgi:hypothetical protein